MIMAYTGCIIITMAMVDVDGSCHFFLGGADSQPKLIGLVRRLLFAADWTTEAIH